MILAHSQPNYYTFGNLNACFFSNVGFELKSF